MNSSLDAAPKRSSWSRLWEVLVDANPVLAKELLITARTPLFARSVVAAPLALGALVLLVRLAMGRDIEPTEGRDLFSVYFGGLTVALGIFGAGLGSTVVVQEREAGTLDTLKFSMLGSRSVVLGKFVAVALAEAALVLGTLPLLAFVVEVSDASIGQAAFAVSVAGACGLMTASLGLAASAHMNDTRRALLLSLLASGLVGIGLLTWLALASSLVRADRLVFGVSRSYVEAPLSGKYVALLCVIPAFALGNVLALGYAAATSGLMDSTEDRGRPIKRWTLGAYATGLVSFALCCSMADHQARKDMTVAAMVATALLAAALLFAFVAEPIHTSRRMRAQPRSVWARVLCPWCLVPSLVFVLLMGGGVLLSLPVLADVRAELEFDALWTVAFLATLGGLMGAVAARRGATMARQLGGLGLVAFVLLFVLLRSGASAPSRVDMLCPFWLYSQRGPGAESMLTASLVAWATAALLSLAALLGAVRLRRAPSAVYAAIRTPRDE